MNARNVLRFLSVCLSLTLLFQLGATSAYATYIEDPADEMSVAAAGQSAAEQLEAELSQNGNLVSHYVNEFDNQEKVIIWTKGITPPSIGGNNADLKPIRVEENGMSFETYQTEGYIPDQGWYDINKTWNGDGSLCFAVAASNSLHWWLDQNDTYIQRYINQNPNSPQMQNLNSYRNSFKDQENSGIFNYFKRDFLGRPTGYWPDLLQDHFLNGYPYKDADNIGYYPTNDPGHDTPVPGNTQGFFYDVFGSELLTHRSEDFTYDWVSNQIKQLLMDGNLVMPTFGAGALAHVITLWGAEYDLNGNISAIFVSDSDDGDVAYHNPAMKRYAVKRAANGNAVVSTHAGEEGNNRLTQLNSLSLGEQYWENYFAPKQTLTLQWSNDVFDYDGNEHKPDVSLSGVKPGDDVQVVVTGGKKNAGKFSATAELQGRDAGKYKIETADRMHNFTINKAKATVTVTANLDEYATNGTVKLFAEVRGVNGERPEGVIDFYIGNKFISSPSTIGGNVEYSWKKDVTSGQITATFQPDKFGISNNYTLSHSVPISIDLNKKNQAPLMFGPIDGIRFGGPDFELNATGGSGSGALVYSSSNSDIITINGSTASIKGVGSVEITATREADADYNSTSTTITVQVAKGTAPVITYPTASDLTYGQSLAESSLIGGSTELGYFTWNDPTLVPGAGSTQQWVAFVPNSYTEQHYELSTSLGGQVAVNVNQAVPTVTLSTEMHNTDKAPSVVLTAEVSKTGLGDIPNDGTIKFVDCTDGTCVALPGADAVEVRNGIATFTWTGMQEGIHQIKAEFSGNANYTAAVSPIRTVDTTVYPQGTYSIVVENDGNGTASANHTSASKGTTVTLTAVPNAGFQFKEWKVLDGQVTLSGNTFVMPDMPVTIQAIFEKKNDSPDGGNTGGNGGNSGNSNNGGSSVTKPNNTPTEVVNQADGTVIKKTEKADGSNVIEMTAKNGTTSVTEIDFMGNTTAQVMIPEKVSTEAKKQNQTISLPMPSLTVRNEDGKTSTITVDVGTAKDVMISVPVENVGPGVVAVAVNPDGTKQVVRKSVVREDGVVLAVDGITTLELQDRGKVFEDTQGHWASDAIAFVTSHEIYNGTSATTFSPNTNLTRGMLTKILHNLEGNPQPINALQFSDVAPNAKFADSIQWAVDSGIVMGVDTHKFAPEKPITREQVAVMLYRYAGSPAISGNTLNFTDADQVGAYANAAICWAVENGIITGTNAGTINPKGTATRAQTAVMIMRFMKTIMG